MTQPPSSDRPPDHYTGETDPDLDAALRRHFQVRAPASLRQRIGDIAAAERNRTVDAPLVSTRRPAHRLHSVDSSEVPAMSATTLPPSTTPGNHAGVPDQSGWRRPRAGRKPGRHGPLGLIATLTLLLVIVASAIAVTLTAPGDGDEPTSLPAGGGGTTTPTTTRPDDDRGNAAAPQTGTAPDGTAWTRVPYADCTTIEPMAYADAMETVVGEAYPFDQLPPPVAVASPGDTGAGEAPWTFTTLPTGPAPDQQVIDAAVRTLAVYHGCEDQALHQATTMTPEGMARLAYEVPGRTAWDGDISGWYLRTLWSDGQGRQGMDGDHIGQLTPVFLYDFRLLDDDRIVAFQSRNQAYWDDTVPVLYQNAGYVVFVERDGRWLIDEQFARDPA